MARGRDRNPYLHRLQLLGHGRFRRRRRRLHRAIFDWNDVGVFNRNDGGVHDCDDVGVFNRNDVSVHDRDDVGVFNWNDVGVHDRDDVGVFNRNDVGRHDGDHKRNDDGR